MPERSESVTPEKGPEVGAAGLVEGDPDPMPVPGPVPIPPSPLIMSGISDPLSHHSKTTCAKKILGLDLIGPDRRSGFLRDLDRVHEDVRELIRIRLLRHTHGRHLRNRHPDPRHTIE